MHPLERSHAAFVDRFRAQLEAAEAHAQFEIDGGRGEQDGICLSQRAALRFLGARPSDPDFVASIRFAAELQAWTAYRRYRQLYVVDQRLAEALTTASWPEELDVQSLFLPVPGAAISVRLPGAAAEAHFIGFYDEVPSAAGAPRRQLRFVQLGADQSFVPCAGLFLDGGRLQQALEDETAGIRQYVAVRGARSGSDPLNAQLEQQLTGLDAVMQGRGQLLRQLLNVLLYIHGNQDVVARVHPGRKPEKRARPRSERRAREKQQTTVFDVGRAFASTIQHWEEEQGMPTTNDGDGERRARPHVRRAHLHLYWTGPGREVPRFQLVRPTLVHGGAGTAAATRRVR